jgi:hypothetical protein
MTTVLIDTFEVLEGITQDWNDEYQAIVKQMFALCKPKHMEMRDQLENIHITGTAGEIQSFKWMWEEDPTASVGIRTIYPLSTEEASASFTIKF